MAAKHGGLRKGSGTKKGEKIVTTQMRFDILSTLRARGFDPLGRLLDCYGEIEEMLKYTRENSPNNAWLIRAHMQMKTQIAMELLKYIYPQRKAIEVTGADGENLFKSFVDMVKEVHDEQLKDSAIETISNVLE